MKIGIILGSTREGRVSPFVGSWMKEKTNAYSEASFEIVDIKDYHLPFLGESSDQTQVLKWNEKIASCDGFIFITAEYNHSITGVLKNALDSARDAWQNKAAAIVSYGSVGGARAAEHLRNILGELMIADIRTQVLLSLFHDFKDGEFKPLPIHDQNVDLMLNQLLTWTKALKSIRV